MLRSILITSVALLLTHPADTPVLPEDSLPEDLFSRTVPAGFSDAAVSSSERERSRFDLGRRLFFDPILSVDRTVSCASCHQPEHGFSSPEARPPGVRGRRALRNPPTLYNRAFGEKHSWDGRAASLAEQVIMPIENENEMDLRIPEALTRLSAQATYREKFSAAFDEGVSRDNLSAALTSFVSRLYAGDSPVDRFHASDFGALNDDERHGMWVFESKGKCWRCHSGPNFSDEDFHNTGVGVKDEVPEPGREAITSKAEDRGAFKTPTLRALVFTAPYMHDGSLATLEDVVRFYDRGGNSNPSRDHRIEPLDLTERESRSLVAFLKALSRGAQGRL